MEEGVRHFASLSWKSHTPLLSPPEIFCLDPATTLLQSQRKGSRIILAMRHQ